MFTRRRHPRFSAHGKALGTAALIVALIALTLAIFAVFYQRQVAPLQAGTDVTTQLYTTLTGLANLSAKNALDPRYTDADGDLVADCPADASRQSDPATLTFSYIASDTDQDFKTAFAGLMDAIGRATGKPVTYVTYNDITAQLQALRDGKLAIAGLNTGSVPLGVCTAGFVPVAQAADDAGSAGYQMQIIAPADGKLTDLKSIAGHELTLTEPTSNSGYKAPLVLLRENGLLPPKDYLIRYSQGQVQSIIGVKEKRFEAAAVASDVLTREKNAGQIAESDYKVIYTGDHTFPDAALGTAYALKPELAAKIKAAILGYSWKGTGLEKLFAAEGKVKFVPSDYKKNWEYVRRIDESIGYAYTLPPAVIPTTQAAQTSAATGLKPFDRVAIDVAAAESLKAELKARGARADAEFKRVTAALADSQATIIAARKQLAAAETPIVIPIPTQW